ncbi:hypothetical protein BTO09_02970 [Gilvibacter sp. SZ-19]|uniref:translocation and assembly module lipoprotein TamL n=1 Tax=Gilvibacter sp. SZ-19 TaxID=754429 RepID=UPI000B3C2FD7|nr:BamA/TamA family outer membrane protein [Gilvibacter sp. SZ-19]ARV11363.1 hypothetical protein BTO09_02970 [Gilvibacter sp. SZ-19]
MKQLHSKIVLIFVTALLLYSCNAVKRVPDGKYLLVENQISLDGEPIKDQNIYAQLSQRPNTRVLGIPFSLHIYNFAKKDPDSTFQEWLAKKPKREERLSKRLSEKQLYELEQSYVGINNWIKKIGEAPVIIDEAKLEKSRKRLERYYRRRGWFNTEASYTVDGDSTQRAKVNYKVVRYRPYIVDSIKTQISSPVVDSLFQQTRSQSFIKEGEQYKAENFENEIDRLTLQFRNSGLYDFDTEYVTFEGDTVDTDHKALITYIIPDRTITTPDSTYTEPFKSYNVNKVRIVTDYSYSRRAEQFTDSINYKGFELYSFDGLDYKPKAITDAISISPGKVFRDIDRSLTYNQISDLNVFRYPTIEYSPDPDDPEGNGLIANILLSPLKKYNLDVNFDASTSTVQEFGVAFRTTFSIRNVFKGAETLELSARGSLGSSQDAADADQRFFNISDVGGNAALQFPRILFPLNTDKIIPKFMSPKTRISTGVGFQNNIGLDRQNLNLAFNYQWEPSPTKTWNLSLADIQYVRNLNTSNFFNVYRSSFDIVNDIAQASGYVYADPENPSLGIPEEIDQFINDALGDNPDGLVFTRDNLEELASVDERRDRLSEDNLIFSSSVSWIRDSREDTYDLSFTRWRWKLESAGNFLSLITDLANTEVAEDGNRKALGVEFSQYVKGELDFIRHWEVNQNAVLAVHAFGGIAIPYGNSNSIPFIRSYFAGGANDNRGWRPFDLGPGSSGSRLDFNEANFKLAFNAEYRFTLLGALKGALFVDAGNIWNVLDSQQDEAFRFSGFSDLGELAVASGFGIRYDFGFFVLRFDTGFKTHNPARDLGDRWFKEYNFANAVFNIGVNYPF